MLMNIETKHKTYIFLWLLPNLLYIVFALFEKMCTKNIITSIPHLFSCVIYFIFALQNTSGGDQGCMGEGKKFFTDQ